MVVVIPRVKARACFTGQQKLAIVKEGEKVGVKARARSRSEPATVLGGGRQFASSVEEARRESVSSHEASKSQFCSDLQSQHVAVSGSLDLGPSKPV